MSYALAIAAMVAAAIWQAFRTGKQFGSSTERTKDADSYEKHIKDIADANTARSNVTDSLPDKDKYRRD